MNTWEVYKGGPAGLEWRWRVTARNGRIVGASSEGYARRYDCVANAISIGGPRQLEKQDKATEA